jgi:hypothetical protein
VTVIYTPRPASIYGRLIAGVDVEQALRARIEARLDTYLDEVERQHGLAPGELERPRAYVDDERFPEDQLPAIVVKSPGTADLPEADGHGRYRTRFALELETHVAAATGAMGLAKLYTLALRALALQQPSPLFMGTDWVGESYRRGELVGARTYCVGVVELEVQVPDVTDRHAGPPDEPGWPEVPPRLPDSPEWPVAASADTELVKVPLDDPVGE